MRSKLGKGSRGVAVIAAVSVLAAASSVSASSPTRAAALESLAVRLGFEAKDVKELAAGNPAARQLEPGSDSELSAMGAIVLHATIDDLLEGFRDLSLLEQSGMAVQARRFSPEPTVDDLAALDIPEEDAKGLLEARVTDSDVKLSETEISRLQGRVPPTHIEQYKRALVERVAAWHRGGVEGLGSYADKKKPVDQTEVSRALLERLAASRPDAELVPVDEFQYWAVVKLGDLKPLVELNHVSLSRGAGVARIETVQIYASHYCESLVTGIDLVELPAHDGPATLMRLTFRAQVDALGGLFGGIKRSVGRSRLVDSLTAGLLRVKDTVAPLAARRPARELASTR